MLIAFEDMHPSIKLQFMINTNMLIHRQMVYIAIHAHFFSKLTYSIITNMPYQFHPVFLYSKDRILVMPTAYILVFKMMAMMTMMKIAACLRDNGLNKVVIGLVVCVATYIWSRIHILLQMVVVLLMNHHCYFYIDIYDII